MPLWRRQVGILEWALLGAVMLLALAISARVMRKGVSTLDENRKQWLENMAAANRKLEEDRKNMPASEHLMIMKAAMEDLLRLDGNPEGFTVRHNGSKLELETPCGTYGVMLVMRESGLRSSTKILHGKSRWRLSGQDFEEEHADPASLMRSLDNHLHSRDSCSAEPGHLARRMRHLPQEPR